MLSASARLCRILRLTGRSCCPGGSSEQGAALPTPGRVSTWHGRLQTAYGWEGVHSIARSGRKCMHFPAAYLAGEREAELPRRPPLARAGFARGARTRQADKINIVTVSELGF